MRIANPQDIGLFIRDYRRNRGLSQNELAKAAGVSRRWLANLEAGKSTVEIGLVLRTLTAMDLSLDVRRTSDTGGGVDLDDLLQSMTGPRGVA